jgi:hypothetical protein
VDTIRVTSRIFEIELDGFYRAIAVFNEAGKPHVCRVTICRWQKFPAISKAASPLKLRGPFSTGRSLP